MQIECDEVTDYWRLVRPYWPLRRNPKHPRFAFYVRKRRWLWWLTTRRWEPRQDIRRGVSCTCGEWEYGIVSGGKPPEVCERRFAAHLREVGALA